jgi:type II secretory pathway pseudopilin PulG
MVAMARTERTHSRSGGYSLLEVQIAFAVLGIALAGMTPLVVTQLKQVRQLELRLPASQISRINASNGTSTLMFPNQAQTVIYLTRWGNPWTQKLAGSAQIVMTSSGGSSSIPCDPGSPELPPDATPAAITIQQLYASPGSQTITAVVQIPSS